MSHADEVREYCKKTYVEPARAKGERTISIRSGDVHAALGYKNRYPLVCSAVGSNKFEEMCGIRRIAVDGPINGVSTVFTFELM